MNEKEIRLGEGLLAKHDYPIELIELIGTASDRVVAEHWSDALGRKVPTQEVARCRWALDIPSRSQQVKFIRESVKMLRAGKSVNAIADKLDAPAKLVQAVADDIGVSHA